MRNSYTGNCDFEFEDWGFRLYMNRFCQETMQHKELSKSFALNLNLNVGWSDLSVWTHDDMMRLPRDRSR